jgi:hypothetical protein
LCLHIRQPGFRLGDLGGEIGDLLVANAGIDVVAVGCRGGKDGARLRLRYRRDQLQCGQLGDHIAGTDLIALLHFDGR